MTPPVLVTAIALLAVAFAYLTYYVLKNDRQRIWRMALVDLSNEDWEYARDRLSFEERAELMQALADMHNGVRSLESTVEDVIFEFHLNNMRKGGK